MFTLKRKQQSIQIMIGRFGASFLKSRLFKIHLRLVLQKTRLCFARDIEHTFDFCRYFSKYLADTVLPDSFGIIQKDQGDLSGFGFLPVTYQYLIFNSHHWLDLNQSTLK